MGNNPVRALFLNLRWNKNRRMAQKKPEKQLGGIYRFLQGLCAAALAFAIALSGGLCVMTAFGFEDRTAIADVVSWCAAAAMLGAVCFSFKKGCIAMFIIAVAALGVLAAEGNFLREIRILIFRISEFYDKAYGWGVIFADAVLGEITAEEMPIISSSVWYPGMLVEKYSSVTGGISALGMVSALAVCWSVCRRKSVVPAMLFGALPLGLCCVITDSVPAAGPLFAFLGAVVLLLLSQGIRRLDGARGVQLTAALLVPVVIYTTLMMSWLPQKGYENQAGKLLQIIAGWIEQASGPSLGSMPDSYGVENLQLVGPNPASHSEVMVVYSTVSQKLYLREQAYDVYTGIHWRISEESGEEDPFWPQTMGSVGTVRITTGRLREVQFVPYWTEQLSALRYGKLENPRLSREYTYTLRQTGTGIPATEGSLLLQKCLELPESTRRAAQDILERIGAEGDRRQIVQAICDYVENSALYDLNTPKMPAEETDFALWFLRESDTGYCIHFASAATVLLRAAGVPARYVSGYMVQTEAGQEITVRLNKAHAWVEYLDEETGWTVLDPTPAARQQEQEQTRPQQPTDPVTGPEETEPFTQPSTQPEPTDETRPSDPAPTMPVPETKPIPEPEIEEETPRQVPWGLLGALGSILVVLGQYLLRRQLRVNRFNRGDRNRQAVRRWRFAKRMAWLTKQSMPEELTFLAEKAAFSQHVLTEEELEVFDDWLEQAKAALSARPWLLQLLIRLIWAI